MSKILVIPDLHLRWSVAEKIMQSVDHDTVIQIGDHFDNFSDDPIQNAEAAKWLRKQLEENPKWIQIQGNHSIGYRFPHTYGVECSGFSRLKSEAINKILKLKHWNKFKLFHYLKEGNFLISHAGLSQGLLSEYISGNPEKLQIYCDNALEKIRANMYDVIFGAGRDRGGQELCGGLLWCDFRSIIPHREYNQIVGHTIVNVPLVKWTTRGGITQIKEFNNEMFSPKNPHRFNQGNCCLNLDTNSRHYALITDGVLTTHETPKEFFYDYNKEQAKRRENKMLNDYTDLLKFSVW